MTRRDALAAAFAVALAAAFAPSCGKKSEPAAPVNEAGEELLDAEKYRRPIQELEAMLYQSESAQPEDASRIAMSAQLLGETIRQKAGQMHDAAGKMSAFASKIQAESSGAHSVDLATLRGRWELLRHGTFTPADWMLHSGGAPQAGAPEGTAPDLAAVGRLRAAATAAEGLITVGRAESGRFPDTLAPDLPAAQKERILRNWRDWTARWTERVDNAEKLGGEEPPAGAGADWSAARAELRETFSRLRGLAAERGGTSIPRRSARETAFRAAADAARQARARIARLQP